MAMEPAQEVLGEVLGAEDPMAAGSVEVGPGSAVAIDTPRIDDSLCATELEEAVLASTLQGLVGR